MRPRVQDVGDEGIRLERGFVGSLDVLFDGWRAWSVAIEEPHPGDVPVPWPRRLAAKLDGTSVVSIVHEGAEVHSAEVAFGSGAGRVRITDRHGNLVFIDKWGLTQRPFSSRREAGAVEAMTAMAERVLDVMRECGFEGWISFGTLLGAARGGKVIGHDSDIDLCFLSEKQTPAEMAVELWDIARALQDAGIKVKHKTASFITVTYTAPDGGEDGIDIYTCFYVDDLLHETATVRERVPRSAILPLTAMEFEGRMMPAPADPDRMLAVSYGPGWRVPDPSFSHQPSTEITDRFHSWFGELMPSRRDWTQHNGRVAGRRRGPSDFARWVSAQLDESVTRVLDVGSGSSRDLRHYVTDTRKASGYDFAHPGRHALGGKVSWPEGASRSAMNLLDLRDVYTAGAVAARRNETNAVTARRLVEALAPEGHEGFWRFTSMALARGGRAYLEGVSRSPHECREWQRHHEAGRVYPVDPHDLVAAAQAAGGTVVHREGFASAARAVRQGRPARWRMIVEWAPHEEGERA